MRIPLLLALLCACAAAKAPAKSSEAQKTAPAPEAPKAPPKPTAADAKAFVARVNTELRALSIKSSTADWIKNTYITDDTERAAAAANDASLEYLTRAVKEAASFQGVEGLDADTQRMLLLLRLAGAGPSDPAHRLELTTLSAKLEGIYGKGKWCPDGKAGGPGCKDLEDLTVLMAKSRNYDELRDAWTGWRTISKEMRPLYSREVELLNEGVREIGFANEGDLWRAGYDMPPEAFEQETDRLWLQVKPLYDDLHCYVRSQLQKTYGKDKVPDGKPIPAHLLGNMWAQEWTNIYPLVEPFKGQPSLDVGAALVAQKWDWKKMVKTGEGFYTSLGLDPLPQTFWERSMFLKPRDREVVCHASAWDVQDNNDLRIKMCIKPTEEDLETIHHELGHNYYDHYYTKLPFLFKGAAHDGFHEAIGDSIVLSMTPGYLQRLGLVAKVSEADKAVINVQLKDALTRVAFLPFGKLIDQWRWDVFSGKTKPADYNKAWWELVRKYQGIAPPVPRSEDDFDPGAKYHVASNTPYVRYFLARILQFQFHRAMCQASGFKGPLHECSVYGNKEAGARLQAMLALGASKPWQEALFAMTGSRQMDGGALLEYFAPLEKWLKTQNQGKQCGW
jgi:peptidyl-dipeptidase A